MGLYRFAILAGSALALAACGSSDDVARPEPRLLGREFMALSSPPSDYATATARDAVRGTPEIPAEKGRLAPLAEEPFGPLTLQQALALSLMRSPELAVFSYDTRAAEARTLQAGYLPNPEISILTEDFGGNRGRGGFKQSQSTLALSQAVELGAKRTKRLRLARLDESLAAWDFEAKRLDVFVEVTKAFISVLSAQRKLELATATLGIEQQFDVSVNDRVRAGKVSPIEQRRADVTVANSRIVGDAKPKHNATFRPTLQRRQPSKSGKLLVGGIFGGLGLHPLLRLGGLSHNSDLFHTEPALGVHELGLRQQS